MTIEPCQGYKVGDEFYAIVQDAQMAAISLLLGKANPGDVPSILIARAPELIAILQMGEPAKPKSKVPTVATDAEIAKAVEQRVGETGSFIPMPMKIIRQRLKNGWTLADAVGKPYTPRPRKGAA